MPFVLYKKKNIADLVLLAQKNDKKALEELITRIQKDVYTFFCNLIQNEDDVFDLTQECLIKIIKSVKKIKKVKYFKRWVNRICTNKFFDYLRKKSKNVEVSEDSILQEQIDNKYINPDEYYLYIEADKFIQSALLKLPSVLRVTLLLREFQNLSYDEISKITKTTLGTVKSRISRARTKMQMALNRYL